MLFGIYNSISAKINKYFLLLGLFFVLNAVYSIYVFNTDIIELIFTCIAYFNGLIAFHVITNKEFSVISLSILVRKIFYVICIWGILQYFKLTTPFKGIYELLIPRGNFEILTNYGRGVSLFSTEPSRAALEFIFISIVYRLHFVRKNVLLFDFFIIAYSIIIIQAGYAFLYSFLYLIITLNRKKFFIFLLSFISLGSISGYLFKAVNLRGLFVILELVKSDNFLIKLISLSGFRVISFFASISSGFHHLFGSGLGNWRESSLKALNASGFNSKNIPFFAREGNGFFISVRPTSYFSNLMLDFGIIGTLIIIFLLFMYAKSNLMIHDKGKFLFMFFVYFFFFGYLGNPIPFICIAIYYNKSCVWSQ